MRGDWMDEAKRFEETDKAIVASLARENDYWKSVGGHPDAGYQDAPPVYSCESGDCESHGMGIEEAPYGHMEECADCESRFCSAHITDDKDCHLRVCLGCRTARDAAASGVEGD